MNEIFIVLLPGLDGTGKLFKPMMQFLPAWIKPVVVSYPEDKPYGYEDLKEIVYKAIPRECDFVILGESFSGPLAIMTAAEKPAGLLGVILCATFAKKSGTPLDEQREIIAKKYGEEKAGFLFKKMLQGYKRLVFIDTGNYELETYRSRSQKIAERLGLRYEEIKGDSTLVKALLNGSWDGDFVVAPPGHTITLSDFRMF